MALKKLVAALFGKNKDTGITEALGKSNDARHALHVENQHSQPLTNTQLRSGNVGVNDRYTGFEALPDQNGTGTVLVFNFSAPVDQVWIRSRNGISRATPTADDPNASLGIYCGEDEPTPVRCLTDIIKVFAPNGNVITVWGYRY